MSSKDTRKKASDVFNEGQPFFGHKAPFDEAFPEIEDVTVEVEHVTGDINPPRKRSYKKSSLSEYIDCTNPLCYNGGISIGSILREMVQDKKTQFETSQFCQGYEGSPNGRRRYGKCMNLFKIKVTLKFKEEGDINDTPTTK